MTQQLDLPLYETVRTEYIPPDDCLRLNTTNVEVRRMTKRDDITKFCAKHHYLHLGVAAPKQMVYSRAYGLYLGGMLAGIAVYNVPSSQNVGASLFRDYSYQRGTLSLTRLCCAPDAPFNSESHLLGESLSLLVDDNKERVAHDKPEYKSVITFADYDFLGHTGTIYRAINAWYTGFTNPHNFAGFRNPTTGEIRSARQGGHTHSRKDCPEGFEPFNAGIKFKFLMFLGNKNMQLETMRNLQDQVLFRTKFDELYTWQEGNSMRPSHRRAYDEIYQMAGREQAQ